MIFLSLISFLISSTCFAADANVLKQIHVETAGSSTMIHFDFAEETAMEQIEARFLRRTIEWDLAASKLKKDKMFVDVSGAEINNIYASHLDGKGLRIRINLNNDKTASNFHEQVRFVKNKNKMTMILDGSVATLSHNIKELSRMYDVKTEMMSQMQEHIAKQSVLSIDSTTTSSTSTDSTATVAAATAAAAASEDEILIDDTKDEKEIPLVSKNAKATVSAPSTLGRLAAGGLALCLLLGSVYFVNKKMQSKRAGAPFSHDSIKVVSQKYLGPKRSLTLVRVSGEYLLLGVTDHNISLIKQLSVIDDEIPDLVPQDFKTAVKKVQIRDEDDVDTQAQEVEDTFSVSSLNDVRKIFQKRKYIDETDV